ncbi:pimeloyl-ACP methyl ester esterase BioH [Agarivorans sp. MS3-6]|uniref:pimeloyl-ACP methyl ester esterase BioH n=1 Tax=Agarivorans sp. TSD2052 TaxID=2937286 RepID=UPI00200E035F|nr:pimeloyl-ACP methyl ester esterase BioH [Agarivorans sp. TSD2052]UPW19095.1 pimeloyl-ACP methyl ester esterase BioH [Agarivorans sp. TSD2052]
MSKLHCERQGDGPALVMIHGWGLNSAVWQPVAELLSEHFCLYQIDLPGFGHSAAVEQLNLSDMANAVAAQVPQQAIWLGWSLGGLVAMQAAIDFPRRIRGLISVASSAHFIAKQGWPGIAPNVLDSFAVGLERDFSKTLQQFLAIQAMGSSHAKQDIKQLRHLLAERPLPKLAALQQGLELLQLTDLRAAASTIDVPWLQLFGRSDALVPRAAMLEHAVLTPSAQQYCFESSSHAPFISEKQLFTERVTDFSRSLVV